MYDLKNIDIEHFYFNKQWSYNNHIMVANEQGFNSYSLTPQLNIQTETLGGVDGQFISSTQYNPRTFILPLTILDNSKIRKISSWLSTKTPQDFYFKNDRVKIKAIVDEAISPNCYLQGSTSEIKFLCHNPYFEEIEPIKYIITKNISSQPFNFDYTKDLVQHSPINYDDPTENSIHITTNSLSQFDIWNDGNVESRGLIKLYGNGSLVLGLNGYVCTITGVTDYVTIDFKSYDVYKDSVLMVPNFTTTTNVTMQDFYFIPEWNTLSCSSNVTKIEIIPRSRWI
jgi:predicted phage tail component-like protein